jgi:transposase-like protein
MATPKYTVMDFNRDFPDEDACLAHIVKEVYPDGIMCRSCGQVRPHAKLTNRKAYSCAHCGTHVYPLAGTIFEKSTTPLKSWFYAMYLMASTRCGISAKQVERELGVTYKTAWRMFTQIRKLMEEDGGPLKGTVEVDETYVGGKPRYRQPRKGPRARTDPTAKTPVVGMVERDGSVKALVVNEVSRRTVMPLVNAHIMPASSVFTDEALVYGGLEGRGYEHKRVNHSARIYVEGDVHMNTIEGFWALLKTGIVGVHHSVGDAYLQTYVNEYAFRYNHRDDTKPMFAVLSGRTNKTRHGRYGRYAPVGG